MAEIAKIIIGSRSDMCKYSTTSSLECDSWPQGRCSPTKVKVSIGHPDFSFVLQSAGGVGQKLYGLIKLLEIGRNFCVNELQVKLLGMLYSRWG